ncbi:MAG: hypothetical protein WAV20_00600, partial [Blastocatellia bacterium]
LAVGTLLIGAFYFNDSLHGDPENRASLFVSMAIKTMLALSFPLLLFALRFFDERELRRMAGIWQKLMTTFRRSRLTEAG